MTQNEVDILKNSVLDATEAYVDARLQVLDYVKTQIGVVVSATKKADKKWYHTVRCNKTQNTDGIVYNNVLSVNNIHFQNNSVVFLAAPNAQFSSQFILGKLDNVPYDIVGGSIRIGGTEEDPNFFVDSNGNCTCKYLEANVGGYIGSFEITSNSLGDPMGTTVAVGMVSGDHIYAWHPSHYVRMFNDSIDLYNAHIYLSYGSSWLKIDWSNIENNSKGNVLWDNSPSDKRYKHNIKEISNSQIKDFFNNIEPSIFNFDTTKLTDKDDLIHYGVIAQNLESSLQQAGFDSKSIVKKSETEDMLLVSYQELHGLELAGIKDLYNIIKEQQKQIDKLKKEVK